MAQAASALDLPAGTGGGSAASPDHALAAAGALGFGCLPSAALLSCSLPRPLCPAPRRCTRSRTRSRLQAMSRAAMPRRGRGVVPATKSGLWAEPAGGPACFDRDFICPRLAPAPKARPWRKRWRRPSTRRPITPGCPATAAIRNTTQGRSRRSTSPFWKRIFTACGRSPISSSSSARQPAGCSPLGLPPAILSR